MITKGIHWLRHDLRVNDNEALLKLAERVDELAVIYVFDPQWLQTDPNGFAHIGAHRFTFLQESLRDIRKKLSEFGVQLHCFEGNGPQVIASIIKQFQINELSYEFHSGYNEQQDLAEVQDLCPNLIVSKSYSNYLYTPESMPFDIENLPDVFSPFRRKVEKYAKVQSVKGCNLTNESFLAKTFSQCASLDLNSLQLPLFTIDSKVSSDSLYMGGEEQAHKRVQDYFFNTDYVAQYKETRNGLDGWDFSSRLSAYLALGCITPRQIVAYLSEYENTRTKNDSTYWLFFELLWREFFHWQHHKQGRLFFMQQGLRDSKASIPSRCQHDQNKLQKWIDGNTGYSIVDACMNQLKSTGFMSNRGRQLAASCFIHELGLDWRWGAAYFEQALIDFDVASNYGNWQYLAGVGADPRGLRQFNLDKQTQTYDPNHVFIQQWT